MPRFIRRLNKRSETVKNKPKTVTLIAVPTAVAILWCDDDGVGDSAGEVIEEGAGEVVREEFVWWSEKGLEKESKK